MKSLIVIGHPEENSFCYNGIFKTILKELKENSNEVEVIDLYRCSFSSRSKSKPPNRGNNINIF